MGRRAEVGARAGLKLVTNQYGHAHWADPTLVQVLGGFTLGAACDFGGRRMVHSFEPDPAMPGQLVEVAQPYAWPTPAETFSALDAHWEDSPASVPETQA